MFKRILKKIKKAIKKVKKFIMSHWPFNKLTKKTNIKTKTKSYSDDDDVLVSIFDNYDDDDSDEPTEVDFDEDLDYYDPEDDGKEEFYVDDSIDEEDEEDQFVDDSDNKTSSEYTTLETVEDTVERLISAAKEGNVKNNKRIQRNTIQKKETIRTEQVPVEEHNVRKLKVLNKKPNYIYPEVKLSDEHAFVWYRTSRVDNHSPVGPKTSYTEMDIKMFIEYNKSLYAVPEKVKEIGLTGDMIYVDEFGPIPYFPRRETSDLAAHFNEMIIHPGSSTDLVSVAIRNDRVNEAIMLHALFPDKYPKVLTMAEVSTSNMPVFVVRPDGMTYESILEKYKKKFNK